MKLFQWILALTASAMLVACGGGGGSAGTLSSTSGSGTTTTTTIGTATTATPASIDLLAGANSLRSANESVQISAVVKDRGNVGIPNQQVTFSADSGNLVVTSATTNESGVATAILSPGSDKSNRQITVQAIAGGATSALAIPVVGTQLQITGLGTLQAGGGAATYTARLVDSSGTGIAGKTVTLVSQLNNTLVGSGLTDGSGVANFLYTPNNSGSDVVSASGQGASASLNVQISNVDFQATSPTANDQIPVLTTRQITVRYRVGGVGQAGLTVNFSSTRGNLSAASAVTNSSGEASVNISSPSAGPASIVAQINDVGQAVLPVQFVATTPSIISVQANPGAISPNAAGSSANQASLDAVVRDATGNPVAGRQVNFTILSDPSGGNLSQSSAITDLNGKASVQYIAGAISTASNGVVVQATVASTAIQSTTSFTVSGQALFISIAFGNVISNLDPQTYSKQFNVYVTDANGAVVPNKTVSLRAIPLTFAKGTLDFSTATTPGRWIPDTYTECPNEDSNLDGKIDSGEDLDSNSELYPGNIASLSSGSVVTGSSGQGTFSLIYGENYVPWVSVRLEARTVVGGTESVRSIVYSLQGLASDFTDSAVAPAGRISPFGTANSCTNPN